MKKTLILLPFILILFSCGTQRELPTVNKLNVDSYLGKWYEIQRFPHSFEKDLQCVTAEYKLKENGKINVINSGYKNGKKDVANGTAWQTNENKPGELKVRFFWPFSGDYYIIDVDENKYSLVGSPNRKYLWILARTPDLKQETVTKLREKANSLGFDISKLETIKHDCEK